MRRARRRVAAAGSRHISLSATDAEWEVVRRNADRRGLSIARYLVGLVERDGSEGRVDLALVRGEQRELLEAVREIRALLLGHEVPSGPGPAEPDPEVPGHDADGARLRREIRDWPARAAPLLANRLRPEAPLSTLADRRRRIESLLAEAAAMQAGESPHAPHLEAMPEESAALAGTAEELSRELYRAVLAEAVHLNRKTWEFARDTGGIPFYTEDYGAQMDRLRWLDAQPDLPEEWREANWQMFAWDARWRRERDRVAGFPQVSGLAFAFDPRKPAGARVTRVTVGGKPLDPGGTYTLATVDFLARGGDGYAALRSGEVLIDSRSGGLTAGQVIDSIAAAGTVFPTIEGRIVRQE